MAVTSQNAGVDAAVSAGVILAATIVVWSKDAALSASQATSAARATVVVTVATSSKAIATRIMLCTSALVRCQSVRAPRCQVRQTLAP